MKRFLTLVITLLASLMIIGQKYCVTLWGNPATSLLQKKKHSKDSVLYLICNAETYVLFSKGKLIDELTDQKLYFYQQQIPIEKKKGKFYLNGYRIEMDSILTKDFNSRVQWHYSHNSHVSHYSSMN